MQEAPKMFDEKHKEMLAQNPDLLAETLMELELAKLEKHPQIVHELREEMLALVEALHDPESNRYEIEDLEASLVAYKDMFQKIADGLDGWADRKKAQIAEKNNQKG